MLTRLAVARRLGKSVATVRRMEGTDLHPTIDARGVHWFAECDVEEVAMRLANGEPTEGSVGDDAPWQDPDEVERLQAKVRSLESLSASLQEQLVAEQQSSHDLRRELRRASSAAAEMAQLILDSGMADEISWYEPPVSPQRDRCPQSS
jgi:hypothetical protein